MKFLQVPKILLIIIIDIFAYGDGGHWCVIQKNKIVIDAWNCTAMWCVIHRNRIDIDACTCTVNEFRCPYEVFC